MPVRLSGLHLRNRIAPMEICHLTTALQAKMPSQLFVRHLPREHASPNKSVLDAPLLAMFGQLGGHPGKPSVIFYGFEKHKGLQDALVRTLVDTTCCRHRAKKVN